MCIATEVFELPLEADGRGSMVVVVLIVCPGWTDEYTGRDTAYDDDDIK